MEFLLHLSRGLAARVAIAVLCGITAVWAVSAGAADLTREGAREILRAVVSVHAEVPANARTARGLGRERAGNGVVIDGNGLVLTIGYLILEASSVTVTGPEDVDHPAQVVAYDHETGLGLIRTLTPLDVTPVEIGDSDAITAGDPVLALSHAGPQPMTPQRIVDRRPFAGYWEYLLDDAIFASPPHPGYGGAPLISLDGRLIGIGSLFVGDAAQGTMPLPGNMFVPIDLLKPILADLLAEGKRQAEIQPWLGVYTNEVKGRVFVTRVVEGGPAEAAGIKPGTVILGVGGHTVRNMVDFFRKVRNLGEAGIEVSLDMVSPDSGDMQIGQVVVQSANRHDWLKLDRGF